jgi:neurofibromin 1
MTAVLNTTSSTTILSAVTQIFERAMVDTTYSFPVSPSDTASLHKKSSFANSAPSTNGPSAREQVLEDLGMKGLTDMSFTSVKIDRLSSIAKWVAALIESLTM